MELISKDTNSNNLDNFDDNEVKNQEEVVKRGNFLNIIQKLARTESSTSES